MLRPSSLFDLSSVGLVGRSGNLSPSAEADSGCLSASSLEAVPRMRDKGGEVVRRSEVACISLRNSSPVRAKPWLRPTPLAVDSFVPTHVALRVPQSRDLSRAPLRSGIVSFRGLKTPMLSFLTLPLPTDYCLLSPFLLSHSLFFILPSPLSHLQPATRHQLPATP